MLRSLGFSEVWTLVSRTGLAGLACLFFYPFFSMIDVAAWRILFLPEHSRRIRFPELFVIRMAGEAVNYVTPIVDIGGEPLKNHLVVRRFGVPPVAAIAGIVVARTAILISEAAFLLVGALSSFGMLSLPREQRAVLFIVLLVICAVFTGFLVMQQRGAFRKINPDIGRFYAQHGDRFWCAVALNAAAWLCNGVETWFFCRVVGLEVSLFEAIILESLLQLVRVASFFIPMNLGAQEGGMAFFVQAMGHLPTAGVAVSLLKRARQLLWTSIGFLIWGGYQYLAVKKEHEEEVPEHLVEEEMPRALFVIATVILLVVGGWPHLFGGHGNVVKVVRAERGHELTVNGKPFYIQGAGLGEAYGKKGEDYLAMAQELGANAVRTWGIDQGTKSYLDQAHRRGLLVDAGIWIDYVDAKKTISYLSGDYKAKKEKEALEYVRRFKRHPAILAWNIGNECIFFTKDPVEREALCLFMESLIQKVKKEDPDHPVIYASVNSLDLPYIKKYMPSVDIVGMNVYGGVIGSQSGWSALDFGKPYVITEFGPLGPWDLPKDAHGKMQELDDVTKSQQYRNHWSLILERRGKNVGGFVFHLGETTQESLTNWNINDHSYRKEPFIVMQKLYGAGDGSDRAPRIKAFSGVPHTVAGSQRFEVELTASDPEGAELSYEFQASTSIQDVLQYYVNKRIPLEVWTEGPGKASITAPSEPGIYRLYGFARDKTGNSASLSRTLKVE